MAWKKPRGHRATLDLIKSCAALGAGIEGLPDAPRFRFTPAPPSPKLTSFTNGEPGWAVVPNKPSERYTYQIPCRNKACPCHRKNANLRHSKLAKDAMYAQPMAGDSRELTKARAEYAKGEPEPLRQWLADQAERRRLSQQPERKDVAA